MEFLMMFLVTFYIVIPVVCDRRAEELRRCPIGYYFLGLLITPPLCLLYLNWLGYNADPIDVIRISTLK
jgi:hypothetical protein